MPACFVSPGSSVGCFMPHFTVPRQGYSHKWSCSGHCLSMADYAPAHMLVLASSISRWGRSELATVIPLRLEVGLALVRNLCKCLRHSQRSTNVSWGNFYTAAGCICTDHTPVSERLYEREEDDGPCSPGTHGIGSQGRTIHGSAGFRFLFSFFKRRWPTLACQHPI